MPIFNKHEAVTEAQADYWVTEDHRESRGDCVQCDGTGQTAQVHDGVVSMETCDICGGSGVDR